MRIQRVGTGGLDPFKFIAFSIIINYMSIRPVKGFMVVYNIQILQKIL